MNPAIRATAPLLMALALAACGGGGGSAGTSGGGSGSGGTPTSSEGSWLAFNPGAVDVSAYEGESVSFSIKATSNRTFDKPFNVGIVDPSGTITTDVQVSAESAMTYVANLKTSPVLPAGVRQVSLEVRLCEDSPLTCSKPLPGSPWHVPLKVTVKSAADAAQRLALSATSLQAETYADEKVKLTFSGQFKGDLLGKAFQVGIFDKAKLSTIAVTTGPQNFSAAVTIAANLQPGDYSSNLEVRLCFDDPSVCGKPVAGSPWLMPLKVSVKSPLNLKPVTAVSGLGAWSTYQGNASHSGFVDASFDASKFTRRFNMPTANTIKANYNGVAIDNGKVFFIPLVYVSNPSELVAINEVDGAVAWRANLGAVGVTAAPATGNGKVFVTTTGEQNGSLWIFDQQSGALLSKTPMQTQFLLNQAPTVLDGDAYSLTGDYGSGISKFSSLTPTVLWSGAMPQNDGYTPAVDANNVYGYARGKLRVLWARDGQFRWEANDAGYSGAGRNGRTVALSDGQAVIVEGARLVAFDTLMRTRAWSVTNLHVGQPAIGNGLVYALAAGGSVLEARALEDGKLQWATESLGNYKLTDVIVSRNLAFVSGDEMTFAIDLATHKVVWAYPRGGTLAVSGNGVLYILSANGNLVAINLQ
jgi:outer membrane protein assembly factor BamB